MMKLTKRLLALALTFAALTASASDEADTLLDKVVEWTSAKGTVEVDYLLNSGGNSAAGTMAIDGKRFRVLSEVLDTWFDGTNQWSYSPSTGEVTLSVPTDEELQQVNPFVIINAFRRHYTTALKPKEEGSKHRVVLLKPKDETADITRVEVSVPDGYLYPARIVVWTSGGETLAINTTRIIRGKKFSDSDFTYSKSIHPDAEIVDLR